MLAITVILAFAIANWALSQKNENPESNTENNNTENIVPELASVIIPTPTPQNQSKKLLVTPGDCSYGQPYSLGMDVKNLQKIPVELIVRVEGQVTGYHLEGNELQAIQPNFFASSDGEKLLHVVMYIDGEEVYNSSIKTHCGSSSDAGNKLTKLLDPPGTATPTATQTPVITATTTVAPTATQTPANTATPITTVKPTPDVEVDEFPTIVLPMAAILVLFFLFGKNKK
jgi:hypothetical protein